MMRDSYSNEFNFLRDSSYYFDQVEFFQHCYMNGPPPPYSREDELVRDKYKYSEVGEEFYIIVSFVFFEKCCLTKAWLLKQN